MTETTHVDAEAPASREKLHGAIFDLDGTLLDTEGLSKIVINQIVSQFGKTFTDALQKSILGRPSAEWTRMVLAGCEISESELSPDDMAHQWEVGMNELMDQVEELRGGVELLRALHARKIPIALATSSSKSVVATKIKHHPELFSYFSVMVCGDDAAVKRGKPSPDIFRVAGQRLFGLSEDESPEHAPPRCVVFEDSVNGVRAGNDAGMYSIALPDVRIHTEPEVRATLFAHAREVLTSLEEFDLDKYDWELQ